MPKSGLLPKEIGVQLFHKSCLLTVLSIELKLPSLYPIHCKALLIPLNSFKTFRSSYLPRIKKIRMIELLLTSLQPPVCTKGTSAETFNFLTVNWVLHIRTSPHYRSLMSCHQKRFTVLSCPFQHQSVTSQVQLNKRKILLTAISNYSEHFYSSNS